MPKEYITRDRWQLHDQPKMEVLSTTTLTQHQLPGSPHAILIYFFLSTIALYCVLYVPQRLSRRKPLPPGPKGWPIIGCLNLLGPMPHVSLFNLAKKYGPIMYLRLGSYGMVIASSPEAARAFLKTHDSNFSNRPPNFGVTKIVYAGQGIVWADYGPRYKLLKKITSLHLLGGKAIEDSFQSRKDEIRHLVRDIGAMSKRGEAVPVADVLSCAMANMLGMAVLSRRVFSEVGGSAAEFKEMVVELMTLTGQFNMGDFLPWIDWMDVQGILGKMKRLMKRFDPLIDRLLKEREGSKGERSGNNKKDLVDAAMEYCNKTTEDGVTLNMTNIKGLLLDIFAAGTDTSSSIIEWAIAELLANPKILKLAHEEMDVVIGRDRILEESDIASLPYFRAICKETFRKHPSTPLNLPLMAADSCEIEGYHIPKGTRLMVNLWGMGRDPDNWTNPLDFNPDRFMSPDMAKVDPRGNHFELIPFGAGRRMCSGARMGFLFVEYILGSLVHAFDWELPEQEEIDMREEFGIALQKAVSVKAMAIPRLTPHVYAN